MAQLNVTAIVRDGLPISAVAAAAGGDSFSNAARGRTFLYVFNEDGTDTDVTFVLPGTVDGQAIADRVVTTFAAAGEPYLIGPFGQEYEDANGNIDVTYEKVTNLTVRAIKF